MVSSVFKPLALTMALVAGGSQQVLALAADNEGDGSRRIAVGFSPEGSAQKLVLRTIDAATSSIRVAAYVFTSPDVTLALVAAKQGRPQNSEKILSAFPVPVLPIRGFGAMDAVKIAHS